MARKYGLKCPVARALDVVGDRWTILIVRDLYLYKTRRFQDFEPRMRGLTPSVLSARLKELESSAVIASRPYTEHPPRLEYFLTPKGKELWPILLELQAWGEKYVPLPAGSANPLAKSLN